MPEYSYFCKKCNEDYTFYYGLNEQHADSCKKCSGKLKRNFGGVSISFRGEGFYSNSSESATKSNDSSASSKS